MYHPDMRLERAAAGGFPAIAAVIMVTGLGFPLPSFAQAPAAPTTACTCAAARLADGWCDVHQVGYVAMVRIPSRLVHDALDAHGHLLDLGTFTCPACRKAIDLDGFCDEHRTGFVRGEAYFSRLTYEMARGERVDPKRIECPVCRRNVDQPGWCPKDGRGMIGNVAIGDRAAYNRAAASVAVVRAAAAMAARCEGCAVAMVTDTECWRCRITYRNGVPLSRTATPP